MIYIKEQIYIPNNKNLKEQILQENYDPVDVGHPGQQRMLELVKRNYWWLGIKKDIKKYMQGHKISTKQSLTSIKIWKTPST